MTQVTEAPVAHDAVELQAAFMPGIIPAGEDYSFLYPWQQEALDAWHNNARRGVIEAVTGSGKTRLGVAAAHEGVRQGVKVLILVPTTELQRQWLATFRRDFPAAITGALGNGKHDSLDDVDVLVAIVHSAATRQTLRAHKAGLLIADECQRYAAPLFAAALGHGYNWRLGLTATYERNDGGHHETLSPYFGGVVFNLWYDRALRDDVIAPFDIALVGVELAPEERTRYDEFSETMSEASRYLEQYAQVPRTPFPAFIAAVAALAGSASLTAEAGLARKYMKAMSARLSLLAETKTKGMALAAVRNPVAESGGTLVFTQTQASARSAQDIYRSVGCTASAIYSGMKPEERTQGLVDFSNRDAQVLAAPRILDEGVDVPEADLGIIVAANRSQRQMVQRLGRVIRKKKDGRAGRLVVLYAMDTVEDPNIQREEFLGRVLPFARRYEFFEVSTDVAAIEDFLRYPEPEVVADTERGTSGSNDHDEETSRGFEDWQLEPQKPLFELPDDDEDAEADDEAPELLAAFNTLSDDIVKDYLKRIGQFPLLTAEQEVDLGQSIEAGLMARHKLRHSVLASRRERHDLEYLDWLGERAMEQMVNANLRLVVSLAKKHQDRGMEFIDLIQEGSLGLIRAVQKFDFTLGNKFSTYATWWIRQGITRALHDLSRTIRVPVHMEEQLSKLRAAQHRLSEELGRPATSEELGKEVSLPAGKIREMQNWSKTPVSLDLQIPNGGGGTEAASEQIYDPLEFTAHDYAEHADLTDTLHSILDTLTAREAGVISLRFGLSDGAPKTLEEIGQVYGVTRERIRQIESKTMKELRDPTRSADLRVFLALPDPAVAEADGATGDSPERQAAA